MMSIDKALIEIENTVTSYLTKDEDGNYILPLEQQRPIFLEGPPGIGKTAIMRQIAEKKKIALVSYSITHHTRQSALGLPQIKHKKYGDTEYDISEYTMSEIISSVYEMMEETGYKEGILFLDEINCVSETLTPIMLQFLQYKVFGKHRVPKGWVVVTAGNPQLYNRSVREFDTATLDRLKRIVIEPDFSGWLKYAKKMGIHESIINYLETKSQDFYVVRTTDKGKEVVTARSWEDLSKMIYLYELNKIKVSKEFISQYIQSDHIAGQYYSFYELYTQFRKKISFNAVFENDKEAGKKMLAEITEMQNKGRFTPDKQYALIGVLLDGINAEFEKYMFKFLTISTLKMLYRNFLNEPKYKGMSIEDYTRYQTEKLEEAVRIGEISGNTSNKELKKHRRVLKLLGECSKIINDGSNEQAQVSSIKTHINNMYKAVKAEGINNAEKLNNIYIFCTKIFSGANFVDKITIISTNITDNEDIALFIYYFNKECSEYFKNNRTLRLTERMKDINKKVKEFEQKNSDGSL